MEIEEALYFFRKNKGLKQKEILTYTDNSVYSKIETGKKSLKFSELRAILTKLAIPLSEFSEYLDDEFDQIDFRKLLKLCGSHPNDSEIKREMLKYYSTLSFSEILDSKQLSNYIAIKTLLSHQWEEIESIKQSELIIIFNLLNRKDYFFQYDYALLANTIFLFDPKRRDTLAKKALPIKNMHLRNTATKEFIKNMLNNLITSCLRKKEYETSQCFLSLANTQRDSIQDLSYAIVLNYLTNITNYLQTKETIYKESIEKTINYLNSIGETQFALSIEQEVTALIKGDSTIPIFIQADL